MAQLALDLAVLPLRRRTAGQPTRLGLSTLLPAAYGSQGSITRWYTSTSVKMAHLYFVDNTGFPPQEESGFPPQEESGFPHKSSQAFPTRILAISVEKRCIL
jgi:hypothetical protein